MSAPRTFRRGIGRMGRFLLNLLFPPRCVGCGELLAGGQYDSCVDIFCPLCRTSWESATVRDGTYGTWGEGKSTPATHIALVGYRSGHTEGVPERMIYHLKHKDDRRAFDFVASRLACRLRATAAELGYPERLLLVTYPPRRPSAVRKDGFDQAKRIADRLSKQLGAGCAELFTRTRGRQREQKKLDARARAQNAAKSYRAVSQLSDAVQGRVVILVDDLCTTGSTLRSCTDILLANGAVAVMWATVGVTVHAADRMDI